MKKIIWLAIIALCMVCFALAGYFNWGDEPVGGETNPETNYIEIATVEELINLSGKTGNYKLVEDIDITTINWTPIDSFAGRLDGNNHKIVGLNLSGYKTDAGLFSILKGSVENLTLSNVNINTIGESSNIGALCGTNEGTIKNVSVDGSFNCPYSLYLGGVAGVNKGTINNCINNANILACDYVGGIVGLCNNTKSVKLESCQNNSTVEGNAYVAGIVGTITTDSRSGKWTLSITNHTNSASIIGRSDKVGGICGNAVGNRFSTGEYEHYISFSSCTNTKPITGTDYTAGILGYGECVAEISTCSNTANITGKNYVGGYVGKSSGTLIKLATNANSITGNAYVGGIAGYCGNLLDCTNVGEITSKKLIVENNYNCAYVGGVAGFANDLQNCENLTAITVIHGGQYVGGVAGYAGSSIGCVNSGEITAILSENVGGILGACYYDSQNMKIEDCQNNKTITGYSCVGGIVGNIYTKSTSGRWNLIVVNNTNNGYIIGSSAKVGGICGNAVGNRFSTGEYEHYISFSSCTNTKLITGTDYTAGILGYGECVTEISACSNTADIAGENYAGSYVGKSANTLIKLATNNNKITGNAYVGGIAGYCGDLNTCTNSGQIVANKLIVENQINCAYVGGIAGYANGIENCINYINLSVNNGGQYVGGIAGYAGYSVDCTNEGNIAAPNSNCVGGIIGLCYFSDKSIQIENSENNGAISAHSDVGGIVGNITSAKKQGNYFLSIVNCTNNANISATGENIAGICGKASGNYYPSSYSHIINISSCANNGDISGDNYVAGVLGIGTYMNGTNTEQVWATNINNGAILCDATKGDLYAFCSVS